MLGLLAPGVKMGGGGAAPAIGPVIFIVRDRPTTFAVPDRATVFQVPDRPATFIVPEEA